MGRCLLEVLQVASELESMLELYRERQPARVLEIGCWDGGTLREWLREGSPETVVAVDLEHRNRDEYANWKKESTELVVVTGSSQDRSQIETMRQHAPYDWVFIDGDHGPAVYEDVDNTLPLINTGGLMLLHDIRGPIENPDGYAPNQALQRLAETRQTWRFVDPVEAPWAHGVGVIQL